MLWSSIQEVWDNHPAFRRPWAYLYQNLSGKYRISTFGGEREPFDFLSRETAHNLPNGAYIFLGEPRRCNLIFTDPSFLDFLLPNGNYRRSQFSGSVLQHRRGESRGWDTVAPLPADARPKSETRATVDLDIVGNVFTNMPPQREGYVRREALEMELWTLLLDDRHPTITLQGRGGVGKTSLALELLHRIAQEDHFHAIIWFSAREHRSPAHGPSVVKADVLSTDDIAREFSRLFDSTSRVQASEARQELVDCLSGQAADGPFLMSWAISKPSETPCSSIRSSIMPSGRRTRF